LRKEPNDLPQTKKKLLALAGAEGSKLPLKKLIQIAMSEYGSARASAFKEFINEEVLEYVNKTKRKTK
jgi:hypothetical protein